MGTGLSVLYNPFREAAPIRRNRDILLNGLLIGVMTTPDKAVG
jgi:hypothetical protein